MTFKEIVELINIIDKSQISFMELNYEKIYLKLDKSNTRNEYASEINLTNKQLKSVELNSELKEEKEVDQNTKIEKKIVSEKKDNSVKIDDDSVEYILSPMVGTIYLSPAPDKPAYVSEGTQIKNGDVVCIIEAMKLMNEIESEQSGTLVEIMVKNEQMVEYGQKLFKIKKS